MTIQTKRIYDDPDTNDGTRILVDRLWPRGVAKEQAQLDDWLQEVAPSDELREWFGHDSEKWDEFQERYRDELDDHTERVQELLRHARSGNLTLLYAATDEEHNNAVVLKEYLTERLDAER